MKLHFERLPRSVELVQEDGLQAFRYLDERLLPAETVIRETSDWREVVDAIRGLGVRGAPALGLAGASALSLCAQGAADMQEVLQAADVIAHARPTAVNLAWAVRRACERVQGLGVDAAAKSLYDLVKEMEREDEACNRAIGRHGSALIAPHSRILTHCNAGSLATGYYGTALGVVYAAAEQGLIERVYADETRPVGQGSRLTVWELAQVGIPTTLICDNMAASLMRTGNVDAVVVGADRIARNGDTANKIGTYGVAVLARQHGIPLYVAAPTSTIDPSLPDGSGIVIEQRSASEVLPEPISGVEVWNPAFDVTPATLISRIVTEKGAFKPEELASTL